MRYQFLRLFLLSAVVIIGLALSFGQLYNEIFFPNKEPSYLLHADELRDLTNQPNKATRLSRDNLILPDTLAKQLAESGSLSVTEQGQDYIYMLAEPTQPDSDIIQLGPLELVKDSEESHGIFIGFYSLLALCLFLLFRPLFKDLVKLQRAAITFAKRPRAFPVVTSKTSSIYPLASSFSDMSSQVSHFMQLHQDLSRILSHEIRTPLARLRLATSLLTSEPNQDSKTIERALDEIELRLNQYLTFARIENQFTTLPQRAINADDFITNEWQKLAPGNTTSLTTDLQIERIHCAKEAMSVALQNLLVNACKYAQHHIELELRLDEGHYRLTVRDDGQGLPQNAASLLTPFERGEEDHLSSGYGLGLYIVNRIAQWHEGRIELSNSITLGGAQISVIWPAVGQKST